VSLGPHRTVGGKCGPSKMKSSAGVEEGEKGFGKGRSQLSSAAGSRRGDAETRKLKRGGRLLFCGQRGMSEAEKLLCIKELS